ncbi:MAG TPA: ArgE/DapE family deacylase [Gemmatimonadaceae bacterium]|nr:ArgE/DapE family deacylase [Gemmatimonadaceae bacterium]
MADAQYITATLTDLVRTRSINPAFADGDPSDERAIATRVGEMMRALGMETTEYEPEPGRVSVVGRLRGTGGGRSLMLYGHIDTVGITAMPEPFSATVRDGKLYGRGAYDMKGGVTACIAAVKALRDAGAKLRGDVLIACVADEEVASIGMADVLRHVRADAAIVTEATELRVCLAHRGFSWVEVETLGVAAHGSRYEIGIDANMRMGRFLARLDTLEQELRARPGHALVGPPSLHAAVLRGGTGTSTYADHCRLEIERRTVPGETEEQVLTEIRAITDALASEDATFRATVKPMLTRDSFEVRRDAPIVNAVLGAATTVLGSKPEVVGQPYWMDAALLSSAGIDTVVIGPTGAGAHALEEWVELKSVAQVTDILAAAATEFCA